MNTRSIRFRLTAWYAGALSIGLGLLCALIWISLSHQLSAELDRELQGRASRLETYFKEEASEIGGNHLQAELVEFSRAFGPGSVVEIKNSHGFLFQYPATPVSAPSTNRTLRTGFTLDGQKYDLFVEVPTIEMNRTLAVLRGLLLWLVPIVILIAAAGGALLSGRALQPVTALTEAANSISIQNLSARLPAADTGDELARLGQTLNTMLGRLEGAVTTLSQFVADASHEFRTPLAVLQTTVELALRRPRPAEEYRRALEDVGEEVSRLSNLVEDLLTLARTDTGAVDMPRQPLEVGSVLHDVLNEARSLADLRQVSLAALQCDGKHLITANRAALRRLFLVLLDNALKYSKPGGEVVVVVTRRESVVAVTVKDFGPGIAAEYLPHIFKRFYRGDPARTAGGYGLGLALAQSIARAHGARILVHSAEGVATEFRVEFAARAAALESSPTSTPASVV